MWINRQVVEDLRADKARLQVEIDQLRKEHLTAMVARDNEIIKLDSEINVLRDDRAKLLEEHRKELERFRVMASDAADDAMLRRYGLTPEVAKDVDWLRLGRKPPKI